MPFAAVPAIPGRPPARARLRASGTARRASSPARGERGITLVEVLIALTVFSLGILAIGQLFPAGSRSQLRDRMRISSSDYAQDKIEELHGLAWADPNLTDGRHPAAGFESLGDRGQWQRFYQVATLPSPLTNVKMITVNVIWNFQGPDTMSAVTYMKR